MKLNPTMLHKKLLVQIAEASGHPTTCTATYDRAPNLSGYVRLAITSRTSRWVKDDAVTVLSVLKEPALDLSEGHRYVLRNGMITGPIRLTASADFPVSATVPARSPDHYMFWSMSGNWLTDKTESVFDIMRELPDHDISYPLRPLPPAEISLVAGGWYLCRNGSTAGPIALCHNKADFFGPVVGGSSFCWRPNGRVWRAGPVGVSETHPFDLVCRTSAPVDPLPEDKMVRFLAKALGQRAVTRWLVDGDIESVRPLFPTFNTVDV